MKYALIGSREAGPATLALAESIGRFLALNGQECHSGNALGMDQKYFVGVNSIAPQLGHLHLPWSTYEAQAIHPDNVIHHEPITDEMWELAKNHHPAWQYLKQGARKMMGRNASIILNSDRTIAAPNPNKSGGGGTGHGIRISHAIGHDVLLIGEDSKFTEFMKWYEEAT